MNNFINNLFGLHGRVAVITGGGTGIGRRIGLALAQAGARTVLIGRRKNKLDDAAAEIINVCGGNQAAVVTADLSDTRSIPQTAVEAAACFGAPSILVNAAGVNLRSSSDPAESTSAITLDNWEKTLAVNLGAPFFLSRELATGMDKGGAIINVGSLQSLRAGLGDAAYGASKGGVAQLTRLLARAWGERGITVNALIPGFFPSEMTDIVFEDKELIEKLAASNS